MNYGPLSFDPQEEIFCITEDLRVTVLSKPSHAEPKTNIPNDEQVHFNTS